MKLRERQEEKRNSINCWMEGEGEGEGEESKIQ